MLTEETIKSSAIEGVVLDPESARSSIAKRLGLDVPGLCSSLLNALSCQKSGSSLCVLILCGVFQREVIGNEYGQPPEERVCLSFLFIGGELKVLLNCGGHLLQVRA